MNFTIQESTCLNSQTNLLDSQTRQCRNHTLLLRACTSSTRSASICDSKESTLCLSGEALVSEWIDLAAVRLAFNSFTSNCKVSTKSVDAAGVVTAVCSTWTDKSIKQTVKVTSARQRGYLRACTPCSEQFSLQR